MTNHKDALIRELEALDSIHGCIRRNEVINIINQHFDAVPDGDMVDRVAKNMWNVIPDMCDVTWEEAAESAKFGSGDYAETVRNYRRLATAAISAMGTAAPVSLEVCALALENDIRYTPISIDDFRKIDNYESRLGNTRAVLTAAGVKWRG